MKFGKFFKTFERVQPAKEGVVDANVFQLANSRVSQALAEGVSLMGFLDDSCVEARLVRLNENDEIEVKHEPASFRREGRYQIIVHRAGADNKETFYFSENQLIHKTVKIKVPPGQKSK